MEDKSQKHFHEIAKIFTAIDTKEDMIELLLDVCTKKEAEAFFQRFKVAQMLRNGDTFVEIEDQTGISSTTITRVNKCLKQGQGYNKLFDKYNLSIDLS